jgi:molybdopterin synthase sulfur carrier subunit
VKPIPIVSLEDGAMRVTVKLHATLRKFLPAGSDDNAAVLDLPQGTTVGDVIARLGIPSGHAKMIVSGDEYLEPTSVLHDGQEVNLFPPLAGG